MGKSKIDKMRPNHLTVKINGHIEKKSRHIPKDERNNNNNHVTNGIGVIHKGLYSLPVGLEYYNHQVGGHMSDGIHLGLMKSKGTVYKPVTSKVNGDREINFYETLQITKDSILKELKDFVPKYYGTQTHQIDGKEIKYIILDDITKEFREPCVMDIKIGRITYDPLATQEKMIKENKKYTESKRELGIAIPGFQVYTTSNGKLSKFGKDYGKKLNKQTAIDAFRIFLNGTSSGLNRSLIMQILTSLWRIQNWVRRQRNIRLISSSLLLVYDARKLRQLLPKPTESNTVNTKRVQRTNSLTRPISVIYSQKSESSKAGFSGQLSHEGPILECPTSPTRIKQLSPLPERRIRPSLKRMHSYQNDYDKEIQSMKNDYNAILDELVNDKKNSMWVTVKIIDFAHVFPAENGDVDSNFLEGLSNLIKVFEDFLLETEGHSVRNGS